MTKNAQYTLTHSHLFRCKKVVLPSTFTHIKWCYTKTLVLIKFCDNLRKIPNFVEISTINGVQFGSNESIYMKLVSDTPLNYDTFASRCPGKLKIN